MVRPSGIGQAKNQRKRPIYMCHPTDEMYVSQKLQAKVKYHEIRLIHQQVTQAMPLQ